MHPFCSKSRFSLFLIYLIRIFKGFSAYYCTYSLQSLATKKILSTWVASKHVVGPDFAIVDGYNSNPGEK